MVIMTKQNPKIDPLEIKTYEVIVIVRMTGTVPERDLVAEEIYYALDAPLDKLSADIDVTMEIGSIEVDPEEDFPDVFDEDNDDDDDDN